jgi:hypothetical protein
MGPPPAPPARPATAPTRALVEDILTDADADEKTRIGVPIYATTARYATEDLPKSRPPDPALPTSQALRVVVWRGPDGVRIAPQGTRVTAISFDALLVALDPSTDLATWLSGE